MGLVMRQVMRQVTRHAVRRQTISEFERAMIVERVNAGLRRARSEGRVGGRPPIDLALEAKARAMLAKGTGIRKTAGPWALGSVQCSV